VNEEIWNQIERFTPFKNDCPSQAVRDPELLRDHHRAWRFPEKLSSSAAFLRSPPPLSTGRLIELSLSSPDNINILSTLSPFSNHAESATCLGTKTRFPQCVPQRLCYAVSALKAIFLEVELYREYHHLLYLRSGNGPTYSITSDDINQTRQTQLLAR
jgi:hypothetical protein